ncbi:MAG: hypothetical protein RR623_06795 [Bacilli bacterium]
MINSFNKLKNEKLVTKSTVIGSTLKTTLIKLGKTLIGKVTQEAIKRTVIQKLNLLK